MKIGSLDLRWSHWIELAIFIALRKIVPRTTTGFSEVSTLGVFRAPLPLPGWGDEIKDVTHFVFRVNPPGLLHFGVNVFLDRPSDSGGIFRVDFIFRTLGPF
jgi:hypothetical protein